MKTAFYVNEDIHEMTVAFDVSSGKMDYYSEITGKIAGNSCKEVVEVRDEIRNTTGAIRKMLKELAGLAMQRGYSSSSLHLVSEEEHLAIEQRLVYAWEDYVRADARKETLRARIEACYDLLWQQGEPLPQADTVFSPFQICRFAGETGPLSDFPHWRVLFKYAGVNLRVRESGKFKGQIKFSKKGRNDLRAVAGKLVFSLVRKKRLFGPYYHKKLQSNPGMPGTKAMAMVERKLPRLYFALGIRRAAFSKERFTRCESQYRMAA